MPIFIPIPSGNTSGTDSLAVNRDMIVRRALRLVGAYTSTDLPRPEQLTDAISVLNIMLKSWSIEGFLWLRNFVNVTLVAGQTDYTLGPAGTPSIDRPCHVFNANRKSVGGNEVPLEPLTRSDYMHIPNKTSSGTPVQYYYDAQTINGVLKVWPAPSTGTTDTLVLDVDRQLDIMADNLNEFDFPPNWLDCITYNLAARLAPEYGLQLGERSALLQVAMETLSRLSSDDRDIASIHFGVRR